MQRFMLIVLFSLLLPTMAVAGSGEELLMAEDEGLAVATFAGGCFWCMEHPFESLDGVSSVVAGYTGGLEKNPTYHEVSSGRTGHTEAVRITYDPSLISYKTLLAVFWMNVDPTDDGGQFVDRGSQYRTLIFYHDEEQRQLAEESKQLMDASGRYSDPIVTEIVPAGIFYPAEDDHQDYYKKNPVRYKIYRSGSGRDPYLDETWAGKGGKKD